MLLIKLLIVSVRFYFLMFLFLKLGFYRYIKIYVNMYNFDSFLKFNLFYIIINSWCFMKYFYKVKEMWNMNIIIVFWNL